MRGTRRRHASVRPQQTLAQAERRPGLSRPLRGGEVAALLLDAARTFASSRDLCDAIGQLLRLSVPRLADCALLYLAAGAGHQQVTATHVHSEKASLLAELGRIHQADLRDPESAIARALSPERPLAAQRASLNRARAVLRSPRAIRLFRELRPVSCALVPLVARGEHLGSLLLVTSVSGRRLGADDLAVAELIGSRAALAIERSRSIVATRHEHGRECLDTVGSHAQPRGACALAPAVASLPVGEAVVGGTIAGGTVGDGTIGDGTIGDETIGDGTIRDGVIAGSISAGARARAATAGAGKAVASPAAIPAPPPPRTPRYRRRILVKLAGSVTVIRVEDVDWIEGDGYYARLHVGGRTHLVREPLQQLETELDPHQFARVHRSAIVRIDRVQALQPCSRGAHVLVLRDGARVALSRNRRSAFEAAILECA